MRFAGHAQSRRRRPAAWHFDDIALQADWYTGDCVFEAPGEHKITDLEWCRAERWHKTRTATCWSSARIDTPKGAIEKRLRFCAPSARVDFDLTFHWDDWGRGALRLGHITLLPDAFDWDALSLNDPQWRQASGNLFA